MSEVNKSILSDSAVELFRNIGAAAGVATREDRARWVPIRADFVRATAAFPVTDEGELDQSSEEFKAARDEFGKGALLTLTEGSDYDMALHRAGDDEFYVPSGDRVANYTLTGRNAVSLTKTDLSKMKGADENPNGLKVFVRMVRDKVNNTKDVAFKRLVKFESDSRKGARGATKSFVEALDDVAKLETKRKRYAEEGHDVVSAAEFKTLLAKFKKSVLKK